MKISHVLLTSDLSDEALRAFEPCLELARELGARVTVLSVVQYFAPIRLGEPVEPVVPYHALARDLDDARATLAKQCKHLKGVGVAVVSAESVAEGVIDYAKEHGVDLIALSTHGRTGFRRLALGSVAEAVLRLSPIPVLSFHRPG